jgi:hypothetical protein
MPKSFKTLLYAKWALQQKRWPITSLTTTVSCCCGLYCIGGHVKSSPSVGVSFKGEVASIDRSFVKWGFSMLTCVMEWVKHCLIVMRRVMSLVYQKTSASSSSNVSSTKTISSIEVISYSVWFIDRKVEVLEFTLLVCYVVAFMRIYILINSMVILSRIGFIHVSSHKESTHM